MRKSQLKHTKKSAGQLGGRATVARHGREHMQAIGKRGAAVTWSRYHLSPIGVSGWAMRHRETGEVKAFINFSEPPVPEAQRQADEIQIDTDWLQGY